MYMISVCMATYNGEKFIKEQIESILCQLSQNDELVISDDGSTDNTLSIISNINDPRIKLMEGPHKGCVMNFEFAIKAAKGDIIFMTDQDDFWLPNKIQTIVGMFGHNPKLNLICHNYNIIDVNGNIITTNAKKNVHNSFWANLVKPNMFTGNCMAFRANCCDLFLPIPEHKYVYHDNWIGLCFLKDQPKSVLYIDQPLINYRRHDLNVSASKSPLPFIERVYKRFVIFKYLIQRKHES